MNTVAFVIAIVLAVIALCALIGAIYFFDHDEVRMIFFWILLASIIFMIADAVIGKL